MYIYIYTTREANLRCSCILVRIITWVGTVVVWCNDTYSSMWSCVDCVCSGCARLFLALGLCVHVVSFWLNRLLVCLGVPASLPRSLPSYLFMYVYICICISILISLYTSPSVSSKCGASVVCCLFRYGLVSYFVGCVFNVSFQFFCWIWCHVCANTSETLRYILVCWLTYVATCYTSCPIVSKYVWNSWTHAFNSCIDLFLRFLVLPVAYG